MIGIKIAGIIDKPVNIPVSIVLSVLSNTTSEKAKLIAVPPMALIKVPMVIIVKSRLHNVFFMLHLPCIKYIKKQEDFLSPCFVKICIISKTLSVKFHVF